MNNFAFLDVDIDYFFLLCVYLAKHSPNVGNLHNRKDVSRVWLIDVNFYWK